MNLTVSAVRLNLKIKLNYRKVRFFLIEKVFILFAPEIRKRSEILSLKTYKAPTLNNLKIK